MENLLIEAFVVQLFSRLTKVSCFIHKAPSRRKYHNLATQMLACSFQLGSLSVLAHLLLLHVVCIQLGRRTSHVFNCLAVLAPRWIKMYPEAMLACKQISCIPSMKD